MNNDKTIIDGLPEAIDKVISIIDSTTISLPDIDMEGEMAMRHFLFELALSEPGQRRKILHALTDFVVWDE
jgi:hypothetical protein